MCAQVFTVFTALRILLKAAASSSSGPVSQPWWLPCANCLSCCRRSDMSQLLDGAASGKPYTLWAYCLHEGTSVMPCLVCVIK